MKKAAVVLTFLFLMGGGALAGVTGYQDLLPFLKDVSGWSAQKPQGVTLDTPQGRMIQAGRHYSQGDKDFRVLIVLGPQAMASWAPYKMGIRIDTPDTYVESREIKGFKGGISYSKGDHNGEILVVLRESAPCAVFVMNFQGMDYKEALGLLDNFDLSGIASALR